MRGKISVIVPVYKVEKFLPKCIDSISNQTVKNLEIILVNDGSPDKCGEICNSYAIKDSRIRVIHKENGGLSDARNRGLDVATGDYVSFIDSDDYVHEKFYETLLSLMDTHGADIAQCGFVKVYEETVNNSLPDSEEEKRTVLNNIDALNNLYSNHDGSAVVVWNKLYKRELLQNIRFPIGRIHEDEFTTYKILYSINKMVITSRKLYYYFQRADSIMSSKFNSGSVLAVEAYSQQVSFFNDLNLLNLRNKATDRLEVLLRINVSRVLCSDLTNKKHLYFYLINSYKDNFVLFKKTFKGKRRIALFIFKYNFKWGRLLMFLLLDNIARIRN